jgi:hypothetical protein
MSARATFPLVLVIVSVLRCSAQWTPPQPIMDVLHEANVSGSLELSGCTGELRPIFPQTRSLTARSGSPVQMMREVLAENPTISISQDANGTIRMSGKDVPTSLLNVRISRVAFEDYAQNPVYTPNDALTAILRAPEVSSFMDEHGLKLPSGASAAPGHAGPWPTTMPRISGPLDNVTLFEALNEVLKTFPGLWVYWNCPQSDHRVVVRFRFFRANKVGDRLHIY